MRHLLWLLVIAVGCSPLTHQQKAENKVVKGLERLEKRYPEAYRNVTTQTIQIDTVLERIEIAGEVRYDSVEVEKIIEHYIKDSIDRKVFIKEFMAVARDTARIDTLGIHLTVIGAAVEYSLVKDEQHIEVSQDVSTINVTPTEVVHKIPWYIWLLIVALAVGNVLIYLRR